MTHKILPPRLEEIEAIISSVEEIKADCEDRKWPCEQIRKFDVKLYCLCAVRDGAKAADVCPICRELIYPAQSSWMDIETAPKDGASILLLTKTNHNACVVASWDAVVGTPFKWHTLDGEYHENSFSHWMPIPAPPTHNSPPDAKASHNHGED